MNAIFSCCLITKVLISNRQLQLEIGQIKNPLHKHILFPCFYAPNVAYVLITHEAFHKRVCWWILRHRGGLLGTPAQVNQFGFKGSETRSQWNFLQTLHNEGQSIGVVIRRNRVLMRNGSAIKENGCVITCETSRFRADTGEDIM